jgi:uncharacterized protein YecE (DUF72 family)
MARREIRIGTAGWVVSSPYADRFPGAGTHLRRYALQMGCVEINSSFYRPHQLKTYERWAASTPRDFRFSVKIPKILTHEQRLADPDVVLDRFAGEVSGLRDKLGAVLVQLPPSLAFDEPSAAAFFTALAKRIYAPAVFEPRHPSWFTPQVDAWLVERRIARVAADPVPAPGASEPGGWRGLTYVRLHGSPRMYYSQYEAPFITALSRRLQAYRGPVWCVFDNTAAGHALGDALALQGEIEASVAVPSL